MVQQPSLLDAGLAGATRPASGRKSDNTLWDRIRGMHLGNKYEFSTFRHSLGAVLAKANGWGEIDEGLLTAWMHAHTSVNAIGYDNADALDGLETEILAVLDPPLNLSKMHPTPVRLRLTELRKQYQSPVVTR